jgi:ketosteroid isomerase-like protein
LDPKIVMLLPGGGQVEGADALVAGFVDMCENATTLEFEETGRRVDVFGETAVASFGWAMVYERASRKYRAAGRDVWVFRRDRESWRAIYRTMLDVAEAPA